MNPLFPEPAPDFSDPLGLIRACHQRMLGHCELLERLAEHLAHSGGDGDARKAAAQAHRYFSTAARLHHQDEEEDLFPRLMRSSLKMAETVHRLREEHRSLDGLWAELGPMLAHIAQVADAARFGELVAEFCAGYRGHIQLEEREFLERAQHLLSDEELAKIGKAMRERRRPKHGDDG